MSFQNAVVVTLGIGTLLLSGGCGSKDPAKPDPDWASYPSMPAVSFRNDVMPIFGLSCTASDCHKDPDRKAGLYLGVRCAYDTATKKCTFPAQPDTSGSTSNPPAPLTDQIVNDVYASLMENAKTVTGSSVKRVIAGDPEHSFLIEKCMDVQSDQGYTCTNQDPSHTSNPVPCGASMPLNNPPLISGSSRPHFDQLAAWIAQGAKNN